MKFHQYSFSFFGLFVLMVLLVSCNKVDVTFGTSTSETDPNITYIDNFRTDIATFKPDSFITSGHQTFSLGYYSDPVFGIVKAGSYAQISLPLSNPVANIIQPVVFDSLELIIKPTGGFYGDSARPMKINVYQLSQTIEPNISAGSNFYNTSSFNYYPSAIGQQLISLYGKSGTGIHIRLSDALGQDLLSKFKTNDPTISLQENFNSYFKGIFINTDSVVTNSLAYFNSGTDSMLIRLSYHKSGLFEVPSVLDLNYIKANQFNNISFRYVTPLFASFINNKAQVIPSSLSGNKSFLNSNLGSSIKITFPTILSLKELHPYINIVKATLVVRPDLTSYTFPYQLPPTLNLYTTDDTNNPVAGIFYNLTSNLQTGNLIIDHLYNETTNYSYDITNFINAKIAEGQFSTSALLLDTSLSEIDSGIQRLIVNAQNNNQAIQLKLYVLGL